MGQLRKCLAGRTRTETADSFSLPTDHTALHFRRQAVATKGMMTMVSSMFGHLPRDHRIYAGGSGKTVLSLGRFVQTVIDRRCGWDAGPSVSDRILSGAPDRLAVDDGRPLLEPEREVFDTFGIRDSRANRVALRQASSVPSGPFVSPELAEIVD